MFLAYIRSGGGGVLTPPLLSRYAFDYIYEMNKSSAYLEGKTLIVISIIKIGTRRNTKLYNNKIKNII